jgi:hypothetical protein
MAALFAAACAAAPIDLSLTQLRQINDTLQQKEHIEPAAQAPRATGRRMSAWPHFDRRAWWDSRNSNVS